MRRRNITIKTVEDWKKALHRDADKKFCKPGRGSQTLDNGVWENAENFAGFEHCPKCGVGEVWGADFANGDGEGTCLNCGAELLWDNEEAEWEEAEW